MPLTFKFICVSYMDVINRVLSESSHEEYTHWEVIMSAILDAKPRISRAQNVCLNDKFMMI